jgi:large-conductance mechanosensitive channel
MDQPGNALTSDRDDAGKWMGRVVIAVILGEAIWNLIVSVMNNLIVPWVGDLMGQSSGLPTSFRQRPYNYPELFVTIFEFCIAGLVAAILNYFFQRSGPRARVVKAKSAAPPASIEPTRAIPQLEPVALPSRPAPVQPPAFQPPLNQVAEAAVLRPVASAAPVTPAPNPTPAPPAAAPPIIPATVTQPPVTLAPVAQAQVARPVVPASTPAPIAAPKPVQKAAPPKPKKPKEVYYNIVGEPMPSDED